jgi:hypothetical protein
MMPGLTNALRGLGGEFEINRVVGAFGGFIYIIGAHAFIAWNMANGKEFNVTEYCLAFPGGLAVVVGAIAGAVAVKDRNVATAQVIRDTGAVPVAPPAGPQVPVEPPSQESSNDV